MKNWDLSYVRKASDGKIALAIWEGDNPDTGRVDVSEYLPAKEAGPAVIQMMVDAGLYPDNKTAEQQYVIRHFANMSARRNTIGQPYPQMVEDGDVLDLLFKTPTPEAPRDLRDLPVRFSR